MPTDPHPHADALRRLMADHPGAVVMGVDPRGRFVDPPREIDTAGRPIPRVRSALDLVREDARLELVSGWDTARRHGLARTTVPLRGEPHRTMTVHLIGHGDTADAGEGEPYMVAVLVADDGLPIPLGEPDEPEIRRGGQVKDDHSRILSVDHAWTAMLGLRAEDVVGRRSLELLHPDDHGRATDAWMDLLDAPGGTVRTRVRHLTGDGGWRWVEIVNHNRLDDAEAPHVFAELYDISAEMSIEEALRERDLMLRRLNESFPVGVLQISADAVIRVANEEARRLLGEDVHTVADLVESAVPVDRRRLERAVNDALVGAHAGQVEFAVRSRDGREAEHRRLVLRPLDGDGGVVACLLDTTEHAEVRRELQALTTRDGLTGCHNRASILAVLRDALASSDALGAAVVLVDIGGFRRINERFGHTAGDRVLNEVAVRLRAGVRSGDSVGRSGGAEFLVVMPDVTADEAMAHAERMAMTLRPPVVVSGRSVALAIGLGVAWGTIADVTADRLVDRAVRAGRRSRRQGHGLPQRAQNEPAAETDR